MSAMTTKNLGPVAAAAGVRRLTEEERTLQITAARGTSHDQLGRALWNLLAPLHGEPPCYALGEGPWAMLDLADTDAITGLLPFANLVTYEREP
jgi:hypothetical protein